MSFHLFRVSEIYSNASGTVQFVELTTLENGESQWNGVTLRTTSGGVTHSFTFPSNLPSSQTADRTVLVATQGFAALGIVTPDFVVPDGFLFPAGGSLNFGNVDILTYGALPADGVHAVTRTGAIVDATPRNFAGTTGTLPPPAAGTITGTAGDDTLTGTAANETIDGLGGADTLRSGGGNDVLRAGAGDDVIYSGPGNDTIDGGDGHDYLYYSDAAAGVTIDLRAGTATGGAGSDTIAGVELLFGSNFADTFVGSDGGIGFLGLDGNDVITGGAGRDHLEGNAGDDTIDGGGEVDRVAYYSAAFAVNVDLTAGTATGGLGNDTLANVEDVVGSVFGDTLKGSAGDNRLEGGDGNDTLHATAGDDTLDGGTGIDTAVYTGARGAYTLQRAVDGTFSIEKPASAGSDSLPGTERLQFADLNLALDLDGHAGQTARLLGAVFGPASVANREYAGIGLALLDGGMSYQDLAALAVQAAGATTSAQVVSLLWTNIVGTPPSAADAAPFVAMLDGGTAVGALTVFAADLDLNAANIGLTGLAQSGLEFTG